jgi:hypothetical protein
MEGLLKEESTAKVLISEINHGQMNWILLAHSRMNNVSKIWRPLPIRSTKISNKYLPQSDLGK